MPPDGICSALVFVRTTKDDIGNKLQRLEGWHTSPTSKQIFMCTWAPLRAKIFEFFGMYWVQTPKCVKYFKYFELSSIRCYAIFRPEGCSTKDDH